MGAVKITFTLALVATTVLSLPTLPTPLKPSGIPGQPAQHVAHSSHADAVHGGQVVESKSTGEPKQAERLEGVRSVSSDPSVTTKKQSASDGSVVQATQQVSTHDVSGKDAVVQLKKSVKLNNEESLPLSRDKHEKGKEDTVPALKPEESVHESHKVPHRDITKTDNLAPETDKPHEPAKPLKGIIEDVKDLAVPEDAVELPRDVTKLSEDNSKTPVDATEDQPITQDQVDLTPEVQKEPSVELVQGHPQHGVAEGEVQVHEEKIVAEDSKKPDEVSTFASADVSPAKTATPQNDPETGHKINKREDTKHGNEKDSAAHAPNNTSSPKTKTAKSDVSKPTHTKMEAHKSTKPHIKTVQETADEPKPIGFKTSREIASPETAQIDARESDALGVKQSPDAAESGSSQVSPSAQLPTPAGAVPQPSAPQAAVAANAETPQGNDTAKNLTATPTESGGGFNPFPPIRVVLQPFISAATAVRDQIVRPLGAAISPLLGPISPGKGGAAQNASATTTSEGAATSATSVAPDERPQENSETAGPTETASVAVEEGSEAPEVREDNTGAASDVKSVALPARETNRNQSQSPLGPFPLPFDPVAAINQFTKPAVDAATNVRDQVRDQVQPIFDAVAPIVDALRPTKEANNASTEAGSVEPQLRASDEMAESPAEESGKQNKRRYSNYKLFSVYIGNDTAALDVISALRENPEVDFWSHPTLNRNVSFLIPPGMVEQIQNLLKNVGIEYQIVTDDIQRWIDREEEENRPDAFLEQRDILNYAFDKYHRVDEISGYLDLLAQKYSHIATVRNIGMTQEGRPIKGVILSTGSNRPVLWFDAGIHAREWVAPASLLYFLHKMTTGYGSDSTVTTLLQTFDFYIFPVVNPDGYAYTFTSDRLWRKNRSGGRRGCRGVDPNRNFAAVFGGPGTSGHPCSDIYRGAQAFSEAESRAIRDAVLELGSRAKGYVTVHSYSQLLMVPYGHGRGTYTRDYADQMASARAVSRAIQIRSGVYYQVGTISGLLGSSAGSSSDWVYDSAKIKYSLAVELRDKGRYGFLLPNFLIVPTADEAAEGFKAFAKFIARRELNKSIH